MHESSIITNSDQDQVQARRELFDLMTSYPATQEEKERSLGLFIRGSLMARILASFEVYQQIVDLPGAIFDMGTWRGQTAVLCENFRAILEPLNFQRRIHAFDTFTGYAGFGEKDPRDKALYSDGTYSLSSDYADLLRKLLSLHERNNAMGHVNGKHKVWEGDCRETLAAFGREYPGEMVALAWFDLNIYEPTRDSFEFILKRLVPGGVIAFWQLTRGGQLPAEGMHYLQDILGHIPHRLHKAKSYPSLCYLSFPQGGVGL
ncbi:MAG TPA: TylF/MycF/NovP-related O-methyltransferase [Rhodocyclaceae bacterium]